MLDPYQVEKGVDPLYKRGMPLSKHDRPDVLQGDTLGGAAGRAWSASNAGKAASWVPLPWACEALETLGLGTNAGAWTFRLRALGADTAAALVLA